MNAHLICRVCGLSSLIPPPSDLPATTRGTPTEHAGTRVPLDLLDELTKLDGLPAKARGMLKRLYSQYDTLTCRTADRDTREQEILREHAAGVLRQMGFRCGNLSAPTAIRRLEKAGWGGSRDHFFHSFQNYFFGLYAIGRLPSYFERWRDAARLQFEVDTLSAWFLTALWHDVGYGVEKIEDVTEDVFGSVPEYSIADYARTEYLKTPVVQQAIEHISCLSARLLSPPQKGPRWAIPSGKWRRLHPETGIARALRENILEGSHGAAGALRLYTDFNSQIERKYAAAQAALRPTVLLACCSIPFHDHRFRDSLRSGLGACSLSTKIMPFACLLAFIDSIQDDRRDLAGLRDEVGFLEKLLTRAPATVTACVNARAIKPESFLWKMIEARDVLGSFKQDNQQLYFEYPSWMVA